MSSFPKAQECSYVFLRQQKVLQNRDQRESARHCPLPSNCFHSNHAVNNARQSLEEQNRFFRKGVAMKGSKGDYYAKEKF